MMLKRVWVVLLLCVLMPVVSFAIPPMPCKVGGTLTVDGTQVIQSTDAGYTFSVTLPDGSDFIDDSGNPAEDSDGLNASDYYLIDIPIYNENDQPRGAQAGDDAVIHIYKDGAELAVSSPVNGEITIGASGSAQVINIEVRVNNQSPTADAGSDQAVNEGTTVTLDGSNSSDMDDGIVSYEWTLTSGEGVTLSDPTSAAPTFVTPPVSGNFLTLAFTVIVTDKEGLQDTDQVNITINDNGFGGFPEDVLTVLSATETPVGIKTENGDLVSLEVFAVEDNTDDSGNMPDDLPYGLFDMQIKADNVGGEATVTFFLPTPASPDARWYKYSSVSGWSDFSDHSAFNEARDQVSLTLTDGGTGDQDGEKNGVIVDPSGLGVISDDTGTGDGGGSGGGCFISILN